VGQALQTALDVDSPPGLVVAGRTDAGVHARGQVVHVDVPAARLDESRLPARVRGLLPPDVALHTLTVAPFGFDARFSAVWRRYRYSLCDPLSTFDPLRRREVLVHRRPLDLSRMNAAASALLGEHDFAAFCRPRAGASTVRELQELTWVRDGGLLVANLRADAFCHHMVRAMVGALIGVGEGRRHVEWPQQVMSAGVRDGAVTVVPAHALVLEAVGYPAAEELANRASLTRRPRGPLSRAVPGPGGNSFSGRPS
jgi:tRNA pseudouridine38-40 synthase